MSSSPDTPAVKKDPSWSDAELAEQKRFRLMAGGGLAVVAMLAFFALKPSADAVPTTAASAAPAAAEAAAADPALVAEAPAGPSVPGTSGGGGGGGGFGGGGGRPGGGGAAPKRANSVAGFTQEHGVALGLSPRAAAALADSAAGRRGAAGGPPTSGRAAVARATTMMSEPGAGSVLVTVPSGTPLSLSGCQPAAGATWCRAAHAGFSGWVRQSDIG